jgi:DNA-binding CsgD family transcriptional regulator
MVLSTKEIAARLGIAPKTVENHLNLALRDIRQALSVFFFFI